MSLDAIVPNNYAGSPRANREDWLPRHALANPNLHYPEMLIAWMFEPERAGEGRPPTEGAIIDLLSVFGHYLRQRRQRDEEQNMEDDEEQSLLTTQDIENANTLLTPPNGAQRNEDAEEEFINENNCTFTMVERADMNANNYTLTLALDDE